MQERLLHAICPESKGVVVKAAAELVAATLWEEVPGVGWRVHDWGDHALDFRRALEQLRPTGS